MRLTSVRVLRGPADSGDEFADWYRALWPRVLRALGYSHADAAAREELS